jgi:hypothetical protein
VVLAVTFRIWTVFGEGRVRCLARGNHVIAKAIKLTKQYPEFKFLTESDSFVANFADAAD